MPSTCFPTIAAAAGIKAPESLPGIDLLDEKARKDRKAVFGVCNATHNMTPGNPDGALQYLWCIEGDYKLLLRYHGEDTTHYHKLHVWDTLPVRLYNLKDDPHESNEISAGHPEIVQRMSKAIQAWHPVETSTETK